MKTLKKFFEKNPSYCKKGTSFIARVTELKDKTVERYKNSDEFKAMKKAYVQSATGRRKQNKLANAE